MAGIVGAEKLIKEKRNTGLVIAKGKTINADEEFMIVQLDNDQGWHTVCAYGADIEIADDVFLGDHVRLRKIREYKAVWENRK